MFSEQIDLMKRRVRSLESKLNLRPIGSKVCAKKINEACTETE